MAERRRFNGAERAALRLLADGHCEACGTRLVPGWHADHDRAFSRGGATDVLNGRALCAPCNLAKGNRVRNVIGDWPAGLDLRGWQAAAKAAYMRRVEREFLLVSQPGSGKTLAALNIAHDLIRDGVIDRVVVVVPSNNLRYQWAVEAAKVGIPLDPEWSNTLADFETSEYVGIVVTYHTVAKSPLLQRKLCGRRTLVILDEVHHAGDDLSWGKQIRLAFEGAARRLMLSGTPFRGDRASIPFVTYRDGRCVPDAAYGYGAAIVDGVCRVATFRRFDARTTWAQRGGTRQSESLREEMPDEELARAFRTALHVQGGWLRDVLGAAHAQLLALRAAGQERAGGLIVCMDQQHARSVAELLATVTGELPVLAISEDRAANGLIEAFKQGGQRWLVAVRMVSEGVDIPRLAVGVYATNVVSLLFFRQWSGRYLRMDGADADQQAVLFIPAHPAIESFAETLQGEQEHALVEMTRRPEEPEADDAACGCMGTPESFYRAIESEARADGAIWGAHVISEAQMEHVRPTAARLGIDPIKLAVAFMELGGVAGPEQHPPADGQAEPVFKRKKGLITTRTARVARLGHLMEETAPTAEREAFGGINGRLKRLFGSEPKKLTTAALEDQIALVEGWVVALRRAVREGAGPGWVADWKLGAFDVTLADAQ